MDSTSLGVLGKLPAELRLCIYHLIFFSYGQDYSGATTRGRHYLALLSTSRQLYLESSYHFYSRIKADIHVDPFYKRRRLGSNKRTWIMSFRIGVINLIRDIHCPPEDDKEARLISFPFWRVSVRLVLYGPRRCAYAQYILLWYRMNKVTDFLGAVPERSMTKKLYIYFRNSWYSKECLLHAGLRSPRITQAMPGEPRLDHDLYIHEVAIIPVLRWSKGKMRLIIEGSPNVFSSLDWRILELSDLVRQVRFRYCLRPLYTIDRREARVARVWMASRLQDIDKFTADIDLSYQYALLVALPRQREARLCRRLQKETLDQLTASLKTPRRCAEYGDKIF